MAQQPFLEHSIKQKYFSFALPPVKKSMGKSALFSILMLYGSYLSAIFGIVGLVYQYGHASEVVDSITVESDIDNFDKL